MEAREFAGNGSARVRLRGRGRGYRSATVIST